MGRKKMYVSCAKAERELGFQVLPVEDALRARGGLVFQHGYASGGKRHCGPGKGTARWLRSPSLPPCRERSRAWWGPGWRKSGHVPRLSGAMNTQRWWYAPESAAGAASKGRRSREPLPAGHADLGRTGGRPGSRLEDGGESSLPNIVVTAADGREALCSRPHGAGRRRRLEPAYCSASLDLATGTAKRHLRTQYGADAIDMEAAGAAGGGRHGIPFLAVKAISDEDDFAMPDLEPYIDAQGLFHTLRFVLVRLCGRGCGRRYAIWPPTAAGPPRTLPGAALAWLRAAPWDSQTTADDSDDADAISGAENRVADFRRLVTGEGFGTMTIASPMQCSLSNSAPSPQRCWRPFTAARTKSGWKLCRCRRSVLGNC